MAGANNRSLKAAGIPKATIQTLRVESGGRLSLKSAITLAGERGLAVGKAQSFLAKREVGAAKRPEAQQAAGDFRAKSATALKATAARTTKENRAAVLAARLQDRAANMSGTARGERAHDRAQSILKAYPGAANLAEQVRRERRLDAKQAVARTMRTSMQDTTRAGAGLPPTRSERVSGLLSAMSAREAQSAARRADAKKARDAETVRRVAADETARRARTEEARKRLASGAPRQIFADVDRKQWVREGVNDYKRQVSEAHARRAAAPAGAPLVHLQQVGKTPGKKAGAIKPGDTLVYNFGSTAKVTGVRDHSAKFVMVTTESGGKSYTQKMGRDRLVAYDPR